MNNFTFKFDGKGGVKVENEYGLNSSGSYTIDGDSVNIDIPDWDGVPEFKFSLDGNKLFLDSVDEYRPDFDLQKK